ncbi:hypothetical protein PCANC_12154 [Puccinia coronata f. sp. avenae]|uniref:Vps16 C-terminal domain-containing protein n=1 Tax=Puccinia coronata f. sp. avenae TaxID=200324 RepID=A0A2N5VGR4_9BASI|nr:hypothetical protein PCANC_12154 [Puccinia coronata f. sp. avenae]
MDSTASSANAPKTTNTLASLCQRLLSKLKDWHGVSLANMAKIAWLLGKSKLCTELLEHELKPTKQILLLMRMDQGKEALKQSVKILNPDLIRTVLWEIWARKPLAELLAVQSAAGDRYATSPKSDSVAGLLLRYR